MKKLVFLILLCLIVSMPLVSYAKVRVAVVDFANKSSFSGSGLGSGISDMFVTALVKTGKASVIERDELTKVISEQGFSQSALVNPKTAIEIGKILGVQYLIMGNVTEYGVAERKMGAVLFAINQVEARVAIDARVIDTRTGEITIAKSASASETQTGIALPALYDLQIGSENYDQTIIGKAARKAVDDLADKLAVKFITLGKVVFVKGSLVKIDLGIDSEVTKEAVFEVQRKGEAIKDPDTGEVLEYETEKVGEIKVTDVRQKLSNAEIISLEKGKEIKIGDELKEKTPNTKLITQ